MARDLARRLEQMLERDFVEGALVWNDRGTINRTVYAVRLGTTQPSISVLREILAPFDQIGPQVAIAATRLQAVLADDLDNGVLVRNEEGKVNRTVYAQRIGVERSYLAALRHVIKPFDDLGPEIVPTSDRLRAILEADLAAGSVVLSRVNSINERHYMALVGITNRRPYASLFAEIETRLGLGEPLPVQLQKHLEDDFIAGTLKIGRGGKVSRLHYAEQLEVQKTRLTPHIRLFSYYESPGGRAKWQAIAAPFRVWLEKSLQNSTVQRDGESIRETLAEFDRTCGRVDYSHTHLKLFLSGVEFDDGDASASCRHLVTLGTSSDPIQLNVENDNGRSLVSCENSAVGDSVPDEPDALESETPVDLDLFGVTVELQHLPTKAVASLPEHPEPPAASGQPPTESANDSPTIMGITMQASVHFASAVARYPELEKHQNYPEGSTKARLVETLNSYITETGDIPRSRGGKADRRRLSCELGFSKTAIWNYIDIVHDYERALGNLMSVHEAKVDEMRAWLTSKMADGTLEVRDGRLERKQLWDHFRLGKSGNALDRYPAIGNLVAEFDKKIKETGYLPRRLSDRASALRDYLRSKCSLTKDRLHYNQRDAARAIGCSPGDLGRQPLSAVLLEEEKAHRQRLMADPLAIVVGGRVNPFHGLVSCGLAERYVILIAESFERIYRNEKKPRVKDHYLALVRWFRFVATGSPPCCGSVRQALNVGGPKSVNGRDWALLKLEYRSWVRSQKDKDQATYVNKVLTETNAVLKALANEGLLPPLDGGMIQVPEVGQKHLPSLAEAGDKDPSEQNPIGGDARAIDAYLDFATRMLRTGATARDIDLEPTEVSAFSRALKQELNSKPIDPNANPATVILELLTRRLTSLKACATKAIQEELDHWQEGQRLLAMGCSLGSDWSKIISGNVKKSERTALIQKYFPTGETSKRQGVANLLKLVVEKFGYVFPTAMKEKRPWGAFFQKRALGYEGIQHLQSYLVPSARAVTAVGTLYLALSGGNCAVARSLFPDCVEDTERPGEVQVTGIKARARGKPIYSIFPRSSVVVQGLQWLGGVAETLSPFVAEEFRNQLCLVRGHKEAFKVIEEWTFRDNFKKLFSEDPELAQLDITPNMLRPTVLLIATLEADGGTVVSRAIGQHTPAVNVGYTDKAPTRVMRDYDIYHFTHLLETVVIHRIDEAHAILGVTPEELEKRIDELMKTGVGTFCRDRFGRPGSEGSACEEMDCWNDCPQLLVVARPNDIALVQIWQRSLRDVEGEWVRDRPERWMEVWLPWLCFVDSVEIKMRIAHGTVWREATAIAERIMASPSFKPMRLF